MKNIIAVISVILFTSFLQAKEIPALGVVFNNKYLPSASSCFGDEVYGATIIEILPQGTIFKQTKIKKNDVIVAIDNNKIFSPLFLILNMSIKNVGDKVSINYLTAEDLAKKNCTPKKVFVELQGRTVSDDYFYFKNIKNIPYDGDDDDFEENPDLIKEYFFRYIPEYLHDSRVKDDIDSLIKILTEDYNLKPWSKKFFYVLSSWLVNKYPYPLSDYEKYVSSENISPLTELWREKNVWFNQDKEMTKVAFELNRNLLKKNIALNSVKYFAEIDKGIRSYFPNYFQKDSTPFIEEGSPTSFIEMAKKINSNKYNYENVIKYWEEKNYEKLFLENQLGAYEGIPKAMGDLAYAFCVGQGVKKNLDSCIFWGRLGAYYEDIYAMEILSYVYREKVPYNFFPNKNSEELIIDSHKLCENAAKQRSVYCMIKLGDDKYYNRYDIEIVESYAKKLGIKSPLYIDLGEAYFWYVLAINNAKTKQNKKNITEFKIVDTLRDIENQIKNKIRFLEQDPNFQLLSDYSTDTVADIFFQKVIYLTNKWVPGESYNSLLRKFDKEQLFTIKNNISWDEALITNHPEDYAKRKATLDLDEFVIIKSKRDDWSYIDYLSSCPSYNKEYEKCRLEKGWIKTRKLEPLKKNSMVAKVINQPAFCVDGNNKEYFYKDKNCGSSLNYTEVSIGDLISKDYSIYFFKTPDKENALIQKKITKQTLRFIKLHNKALSQNRTSFRFDDGEYYLVRNKKIVLTDVIEPFIAKQNKLYSQENDINSDVFSLNIFNKNKTKLNETKKIKEPRSDKAIFCFDKKNKVSIEAIVPCNQLGQNFKSITKENHEKLRYEIKNKILKNQEKNQKEPVTKEFTELQKKEKVWQDPDPIKFIDILEDYTVAINTTVRSKPSSLDSKTIIDLKMGTKVHVLGKPENHSKWFFIEYIVSDINVRGYILQDKLITMRGSTDPSITDVEKPKSEDGFGNYYALFIAIDKYENIGIDNLKTPVNDAKTIENILFNQYQFIKTTTLYNEKATRKRVYQELDILLDDMTEDDNLLIFYSGHGKENTKLNTAYWLLHDANPNEKDTWLNLDGDLLPYLNGMDAGHVLVVVDACFAGKIFTQKGEEDEVTIDDNADKKDILSDYKKTTSRLGLTASVNKPIPDAGGGGKHSVFAKALIDILENNEEDFISSENIKYQLQSKIKEIRKIKNLPDIYRNIKPLHDKLYSEKHEIGGKFYFDLID